ncbi:phosphoribosylformylglycinamidine synthase subunit PurL [Halarchaeum nitratireducens]|uniref:Phosphoribosylformylglycinamidine synthase subunit PurL n=1 Tax=Halarchaeum nitratireducens TaxID=489913 RepID=A0A830GCH5_9EURY|nr:MULTISPECIES: phosphoribosylformylglycinamidine synthase subunit PurL [Halarchaeum]MBP2252122.1 phosphoribosylformylglycinamidine synthase [Halarchaeum solikamskense]GGN17084.1 phosphoribosylformylglycinamidine synthase [Halarchaeum nitratireducens]
MTLAESDRERVVGELGRDPTRAEAALFENLWSEHCAYRSSLPLLSAFDSESEDVVVGPGDDAAVVEVGDGLYATFGVESHNHPSYVDPFDGAATGVGGIVRDTLSMGAYPVALADCLYFGGFEREHSRYLLEGVVEGISHYGNAIGVPTVGGSTAFHEGYEGNPLVNVACVGLLTPDRLVTAEAQRPGNRLVLVGNSTGRDGLGGASFASEDLAEDAETEDRPAVQVGDPYAEKRLIEANEELIDAGLVQSARDLGAAGLGGASSELVAKGHLGCEIDLNAVHQREPGMNATEILLAESQERMVYEVAPENVDAVREVAAKFDLGCSDIGEVTGDGQYVCGFDGDVVVDAPAEFLADGAPLNDLPMTEPETPATDYDLPALDEAFETVVANPNTASKRWVYRQYDHEVGARTAVRPGEDGAVLALHELADAAGGAMATSNGDGREDGDTGGDVADAPGLALAAGANPNWTACEPYAGAYATAVENATNLAAVGADPVAAVDCLNGGNPEKPDVYGGFGAIVDGLADGCRDLSVPVVGGNVSLYNDSEAGPIPPTPTLAMLGTTDGVDAPGSALAGDGTLLLVGDHDETLGGSELLAEFGGSDAFPDVSENAGDVVATLGAVAGDDTTTAVHDVSDGGLAVTLAETITADAGADVSAPSTEALFSEAPGRAVIETTDPEGVKAAFDGVATVVELGASDASGTLTLTTGDETAAYDHAEIVAFRETIAAAMD